MKSLASAEVLSETRKRLLRMREDDRARWGRMTAKQMVRHLACAYEIALGERGFLSVKKMSPGALKWVALRSGLRWPKNIATTSELRRIIEEDTADTFGELVNEAVAKMEAVAGAASYEPTHPMFGPMSGEDWMRWGYLHADHHLRQFGR